MGSKQVVEAIKGNAVVRLGIRVVFFSGWFGALDRYGELAEATVSSAAGLVLDGDVDCLVDRFVRNGRVMFHLAYDGEGDFLSFHPNLWGFDGGEIILWVVTWGVVATGPLGFALFLFAGSCREATGDVLYGTVRQGEVTEHVFVGRTFPVSCLVRNSRGDRAFRATVCRSDGGTVVQKRVSRIVGEIILGTISPYRVRTSVQEACFIVRVAVQFGGVRFRLLYADVRILRSWVADRCVASCVRGDECSVPPSVTVYANCWCFRVLGSVCGVSFKVNLAPDLSVGAVAFSSVYERPCYRAVN